MRLLYICLLFIALIAPPTYAKVSKLDINDNNSALLLKSDTLPMVVVQISFSGAGAINDPKNKAGLAYVASEMLTEGAGNLNSKDFQHALENKAIELAVSAGRENITITMQTLSKHLPEAMNLLNMLITKPQFSKSSLEKILSQAISNIKQLSQNPNWIASTHFNAEAYGNHPYGLPIEGTKKSLKSITTSDLQKWHKNLTINNITISAAGDISEESLSQHISAILNKLPEQSNKQIFEKTPNIAADGKPIIIKQDIPQTVAIFGLPSIERKDPNFYAAYIMNHILGGGGLTSRLSNNIRQKKGLAYYASSNLSSGKYNSSLIGQFATRNESAFEASDIAYKVLKDFAENGASEAEVKNSIDYITGSFSLALDKLISQVRYLTSMQQYDLGTDYIEKRNEYFRNVTTSDVNNIAKTLLAKPPLMIFVGNPKESSK